MAETCLLEDGTDSVVEPYHPASNQRWPLPEEQVCSKDTDEREVLLTAEPHDGQRCFHTHGQVLVLQALHSCYFLGVLVEIAQQLVLALTPSANVGIQGSSQLPRCEDAVCNTTQ